MVGGVLTIAVIVSSVSLVLDGVANVGSLHR